MTDKIRDKNIDVSVSFDVPNQDSDSGKFEKINSIHSLAAKLSPKEIEESGHSGIYTSLQNSKSMKSYSMPKLDEIFSTVSEDYNGTDGKQDGIIGDFRQGATTGDCWLLAKAKLISKTPEGAKIIKDSIKDNNNGTFAVTFKGAPNKSYTVTEEEIRKSKDALSRGDKDARILEIAADKWDMETQSKSIGEGGTSSKANFLLIGQKNTVMYFSKHKGVLLFTVTNDKKMPVSYKERMEISLKIFNLLYELNI